MEHLHRQCLHLRYQLSQLVSLVDGSGSHPPCSSSEQEVSDSRDISGHRDIPGLRMSRRRKDEVLEEIEAEFQRLDGERGLHEDIDFTEPLTQDEKYLVIHYMALMLGRKEGREAAEWEYGFRQRHGIKPEDPLPSPREMLRMEEEYNADGSG